MKHLITVALLLIACIAAASAHLSTAQSEYTQIKLRAEQLYRDGSFAQSHEEYTKARALSLNATESRWVDFRLADTTWRSQDSTNTSDSTKYDEARQQLEELIRKIIRVEDRDIVWAEVNESLGDFWWMRRNSRNWGAAWNHYNQALEWWAGSPEVETARDRYLKIISKCSTPTQQESSYYYGYYGNYVPLEILENGLKIAVVANDRAHLHFLIAMTIRSHGGDPERRQRVPQEFEAALEAGRSTAWYDDALFFLAEWMNNSGRVVFLQDGNWTQQPDHKRALELFRRLITEYQKGETRYYDQAIAQIETITKPSLGVGVSNIFLPNSEVQYFLSWRNLNRIDLSLYKVDLLRDARFSNNAYSGDWINRVSVDNAQRIRNWTKAIEDKGDHKPGQEQVRLEGKLAAGAYVLEAMGGGLTVRDLLLVTDASVVMKTSPSQALLYVCDVNTGAPIPEADTRLWYRGYEGSQYIWREQRKSANAEGIAIYDLTNSTTSDEVFAAVSLGDRQAFSRSHKNSSHSNEGSWRIYAITDRPAYRPNEEVQWKFIARQHDGRVYSTPVNQQVEYEIVDPKGTKVSEGRADLNAFGSAWGSLKVTPGMPLGEYRIGFYTPRRGRGIGSAMLFRLEEYKLPEFKVSVTTPDVNGRKKAFQLGDRVEANIQAEYYFGGPVSNASVEVLLYQKPFYHYWAKPRDYDWYYEGIGEQRAFYHGPGTVIRRETIKTDAAGKAKLAFDTPRNSGQDLEYRIEARVTDASRREIAATGSVRVTRQPYYIYTRARHNIHRPQDKTIVDIKTLDANDQPVSVEGTIKVTRDYWYEIWIDPSGREVKGEQLKSIRQRSRTFPPPVSAGSRPWQLKFQGYEHDEVLTQTIKTNEKGEGEFSFTPEREGYYRVAMTSGDLRRPVKAETAVWVATNSSNDLGYRHRALEIIVDNDTFRAGQKTPLMISTDSNDRWVLLSVEGSDLYDYQLVHLTGNVKLIELPIEEKHVPNIFLSALMVADKQIFADNKQVIVPPEHNFLRVEVECDREEYQPRDEGTLTVRTRGADGKPVAAEVALATVDESIFYIQQDYTEDPRKFYYGSKRSNLINTSSTLTQKPYLKLVEDEKKQLIDERLLGAKGKDQGFERLQLYADLQRAPATARSDIAMLTPGVSERNRNEVAGQLKSGVEADAPAPKEEEMHQQDDPVQVRSDFRATAFWKPDVVTDTNGTASLKIKYPDSLTGWKVTARAASDKAQFGVAYASARTKQPLIVRLQAPRFFVAGDTVTVSAVINNNTDSSLNVAPEIFAEGVSVMGLVVDGKPLAGEPPPLSVPANGESRVDWLVSVKEAGEARLRVSGRAGKLTDAMEKSFSVYEHGIEKLVTKSGKMRSDAVTVRLNVPAERKRETTSLSVQVAPSMAVTMLDALPYLIDYPYGCTEQTMSRFLPATITRKTLKDLGLKPENVMGRIFGGIERPHLQQTHKEGPKDLRQLDRMVEQGLDRLYSFQHSDGGWGWWKEDGSDHFMSAYVVWGLTLARDAGVDVREEALSRGVEFLRAEIVEEELAFDRQAWMLHALSVNHASMRRGRAHQFETKAIENLWENRERLNAYTRALLALSVHNFGQQDRARILVANLENGVKRDSRPDTSVVMQGNQAADESVLGTAHWGEDGIYWRWSEGGVEATAFALRALLTIDPSNKLIEPVTNWLVKNRRGAQWSNTRDTAITVLTMNDYLRRSGELAVDVEYDLLVNGQQVASRRVSGEEAIAAPSQFEIDRELIRDGVNEIRIARKRGNAPLYFSASAKFFSFEEPITPAGNEIFVRREYYKLVARPTLLKGYVYDRVPLGDGESVTSGERVEAVLTIESKNNYEYLLFEDLKPAGFEAVEIRSGQPLYARQLKSGAVKSTGSKDRDVADFTGESQWIYQELRDRKIALFLSKLDEGVWEIRYSLRAEVPGKFHALPVMGHAMYVPEIKCNGTELRVSVLDRRD